MLAKRSLERRCTKGLVIGYGGAPVFEEGDVAGAVCQKPGASPFVIYSVHFGGRTRAGKSFCSNAWLKMLKLYTLLGDCGTLVARPSRPSCQAEDQGPRTAQGTVRETMGCQVVDPNLHSPHGGVEEEGNLDLNLVDDGHRTWPVRSKTQ